ncbi:acyl-CoA dehydratase activase [Thermosulfurimonas sp. F29]|uniref:acyl-CoA dehydratase activase n=1 Tax=Thermosulfurimonas sp. F29 TaxID=2867247 RepID=UPI001C83BAB5|nr:acyl-CoA dehydratase activase [Thermosulfurimonas sp. F29]MBX6423079.1 acyl-CoA dehydratase activase [Thermosulfurimonas sp. F29]
MRVAGLDIGSRTVKLVIVDEYGVIERRCVETSARLGEQLHALLSGLSFDRLIATGYGRNLAGKLFGAETLTEIRAHAMGVRSLFPEVRTVLDIGGQDSKAILLDPEGRIVKFEMNDRCAAGTGRFLEVMALTLGVRLEELAELALKADQAASISALCTVFAESEVVGLIGRGEKPERIARGIICSIVKRSLSLLNRVSSVPPLVFTGGVARNRAMLKILEEKLGFPILVPEDPQITGALGAALYGMKG